MNFGIKLLFKFLKTLMNICSLCKGEYSGSAVYKRYTFSTLEYAKAISLLKGWLHEQQEKPRFVVTANPEIVMSAKENTEKSKEFKKMLLSADLITADGIGVIIGSKILKGSLKERVTGADLTHDLIKYCNDNEYRVFLFGSRQKVITRH